MENNVDFFSAIQNYSFFRIELARWLSLSDLFTLRSMFASFEDQIVLKKVYNETPLQGLKLFYTAIPDPTIFNETTSTNMHIEKFKGWFYPDNIRYREYANNVLHGITYSEYPNASHEWDMMICVAQFRFGVVEQLSFWNLNHSDNIFYLQSEQHWKNGKRIGVQTLKFDGPTWHTSWYRWKFPHDVEKLFDASENHKVNTAYVNSYQSELVKLIQSNIAYMEVLYDDDGNFCEMACFESESAIIERGIENSLVFTIKRCPVNEKNLIIIMYQNTGYHNNNSRNGNSGGGGGDGGGNEMKYRFTCTDGVLVLKEQFMIPRTQSESVPVERKRKCLEFEIANDRNSLFVEKKYKVDLNNISKKNPKGYIGMVYHYNFKGTLKKYEYYKSLNPTISK